MDKDKKVRCAKTIANDPDMMDFLTETFCPIRSKTRVESEKNVLALNNEDYGKAMKVLFMTEVHFVTAMNDIRQKGKKVKDSTTPKAPA